MSRTERAIAAVAVLGAGLATALTMSNAAPAATGHALAAPPPIVLTLGQAAETGTGTYTGPFYSCTNRVITKGHQGTWHAQQLRNLDEGWVCTLVPSGTCTPATNGAISCAGTTVAAQGPDRYIFCAVAGNTDLNGNPIAPGTSLNLTPDQVVSDPHYTGATIGFFVPGVGATCQLTPEQAALAATSTTKVNHVGGTGDPNQPELYTYVS